MNTRFLVCGLFIALLWNANEGESVLLTTTLMTGFVGGFLIGKMTLGTFLGLLNNNGTGAPSLPSLPLPSVNLSAIRLPSLPSFPTLIPQEDLPAADISSGGSPSKATSPPATLSPAQMPYYAAPSMPQIYTYSVPMMYPYQTYVTTTTTTSRPATEPLMIPIPIKPVDVPISLDNKIRDRFIQQLAIMDPLNCLPKIFCEVSADPLRATFITNHGTITSVGPSQHTSITPEEIAAYEDHLRRKQTPTSTPRPTTSTTTTSAPVNNEETDDSGSASEEDDLSVESGSDEDDSFEQFRKEQEHKIEMQALEEMIDDIEDPEMYMLVLRDKKRKKAAMKKYKAKQRQKTSSSLLPASGEGIGTSFRGEDFPMADTEPTDDYPLPPLDYDVPNYDLNSDADAESGSPFSFMNRRMSSDGPRPPPPMEPPQFYPPMMYTRTTEAPLSDMFADDPFFDDFPSSKRLGRNHESRGKRRVKRSASKEDLMRKYRIAYMIAEKFRKPEICTKVFPSCPYRADTILSVVNRLESGLMPFQLPTDKKAHFGSQNNNNIAHFKNTLQAIERLNKATMQYYSRGEPVDEEKLAEVAASPLSSIEASTSQNIVKEFQQVVAKIKAAKLKKRKKHKRKKHSKNQSKYDAVHYYKKAQMENLKPKERVKTGLFHAKQSSKQHDDEQQATRLDWGQVPSFKQTYKEMFKVSKSKVSGQKGHTKTSNRRKASNDDNDNDETIMSTNKPKPEMKVNAAQSSESNTRTKVAGTGSVPSTTERTRTKPTSESTSNRPKGHYKTHNRRKTSASSTSNPENLTVMSTTTTSRSKSKPTTESKLIKKFSSDTEDDEMDAQESEEAVNALLVRGKQHRSLLSWIF